MEDLVKRGVRNRHVGSTSMNERSSRSHSVLTTHIESKAQKDGLWNIRMSRFHIIDLAGSERSKAANTVGDRLKEAGMINKSLSTLGNVINSLVEVSEGRARHIHYRDSKLTFLLRDSLGGNSKTLIIANVSPNAHSFGETMSTLKFAQRAKLIKNKAIINEDSAGTVAILKEEIKRLKTLLARQQTSEPENSSHLHQLFTKTLEKINSYEGSEEFGDASPGREMSAVNKKRILELEKLLQTNLDFTAQIQEYYDKDVEEKDEVIQKYRSTIDSFEHQRTRDKMIIKFRDATIKRFGNLSDKLSDEEAKKELGNKVAEVEELKQQIESNPQTAKLFVENKQLKKQNDEMKKITEETTDSLHSQYRSAIEFTDTLNKYIKEYIEKEEMDRDEIVKAQVDVERAELKIVHEEDIQSLKEIIEQSNSNNANLTSNISELESQKQDAMNEIFELKQQIEALKEKATEDLELSEKRFAESLEQVKTEVKEGKDSEIQDHKIKQIELEKSKEEQQKTISKLSEQKDKSDECIVEMKNSLESLEKEKIEYLTQVDNLQVQIVTKTEEVEKLNKVKSIKETLDQEVKKLKSDFKKLEKTHTKTTDTLESTREELSELKGKYASLEEENDTALKESEYKISTLEEKMSITKNLLETSTKQLDTSNKQLTIITKQKEEAEKEQQKNLNKTEKSLKMELQRQNSKSENLLSGVESELATSKKELELANKQISELKQNQEVEHSKTIEYEQKLEVVEKKIEEVEKEKEQLQIEFQIKDEAFETKNEDLTKLSDEIKTLKERNTQMIDQSNNFEEERAQYQEKISDLEVKNEWLTVSDSDKKKSIKEFERELTSLKDNMKKKEEEFVKLKQHKDERDVILRETQKTIKGSKESIKLLRDEKEKFAVENEKLRKELNSVESKIQEMDMERQIKEEQDKVHEEEKQEKEKVDKENIQKEQEEELSKQSSLTPEEAKILLYQIRKREKDQKKREQELKDELEDLKFQLDKMQTISDYEGHNNPGQKIRHLLKIKEENNQLKKELCKLFVENQKMQKSQDLSSSSSKNHSIEFYEQKAKKYKYELEKKRKEIKETCSKVGKLCDYILSRPSIPKHSIFHSEEEGASKMESDEHKLKQAIEAIAYMSRSVVKREKEKTECEREKVELQYTLDAVKRERDYLRKNLDMVAKTDYEKKKKTSP